jgi:adenosylmethionine-8-amino-7-oxononanoate aminotransferase
MSDLLILGTDTDAGKTTFAALWLSVFADTYEYWKPVETGPSDTETIGRLVTSATIHVPYQRFDEPVAPPLAALRRRQSVASAEEISQHRPTLQQPHRHLLIETFGGPLSPLTQRQLQLVLIQALDVPCILVSSSALGAIGRTLQCLAALEVHGIIPKAVVLIGAPDEYAVWAIATHGRIAVHQLRPLPAWDADTVRKEADAQRPTLHAVAADLEVTCAPPHAADIAFMRMADATNVWHPYTSLHDPDVPVPCTGAEGEFLHLMDGRRIIDGISSWWTILHGHRHTELMQALAQATTHIDHVHFAGVTHEWAVKLAGWLLRDFPWLGGRVFYSDNGSTAVEVALKMAYQFWCHQGEPQRTRFVGFEHGYHGDTFGAMAVSRDPVFFGRFEPLLLHADILPLDAGRLDDYLQSHRAEVAGIIVEPLVQGAGGMRMHTPATLCALADVARRHQILLIADEVMTGGGRTGSLWAHRAAEVVPDLVCAAKTLAGGVLPLAATIVAPHVVAAFDTADRTRTFFHGHSFTAHPLACAVACANAQLLDRPETLARPRAMEAFWIQRLQAMRRAPRVKDVRICGSIAAIELEVPGGYLAEVGRTMRHAALKTGVLLRPLGSVLYSMPPFCTSQQSLERIADAMYAAVRAVADN